MAEQALSKKHEDSKRPTLYMIVGLPGSGKTTRAREIESEKSALRLTPDDWILTLYGNDLDQPRRDAVRDPVEAVQWQVAKRALSLGCSVILDWGFWTYGERIKYREQVEALGARVKVIFLDVTIDELWSRISQRVESSKGTLHITRLELEDFSNRFEPPNEEELL